ncbi:Guanine nucleotide-binding proteinalpha-5 subunit [Toxocara canis]|uniref:Guanine nucleotide-binding proteinalpha-5 subunit n=1 Tax=Toxocara canis TaxID=6265 RepID=A0A0B2VJQ0_TOXCA|nr:Guanine nucleotide-binding proteinalpha-5 subunit [Toxocara canis]
MEYLIICFTTVTQRRLLDSSDCMGAALCGPMKALDEESRKIEEELRRERYEEKRRVKILLLGSSDSGKSTIAKQMRIIHASGFTESELINFKLFVMNNVIECFRQISLSIRKLKIDVPSTEAGLVNKLCKTPEEILNAEQEEQRRDLAAMRSFACVKNLLARVDEVNLPDNTDYFLAELDRILAANYKPTNKDVIHLRASTTGVHEIAFGFKKYVIRLIDVGGQKSERRKWIHCFENVTAVLFVASLSCYDMFLEDDPKTNPRTVLMKSGGRLLLSRT